MFKQTVALLFGRKKPASGFDFTGIRSVLIRPMGHSVGDAVMHTVYIRQLKAAWPNCRIGVVALPKSRPVYDCCPEVDELVDDTFSAFLRQRRCWQVQLDFYETYNSKHIIKTYLLAPEVNIIFNKKAKAYYSADNIRNYDFHCPGLPGAHFGKLLESSVLAEQAILPAAEVCLKCSTGYLDEAETFWQQGEPYDRAEAPLRILLAPQGSVVERSIPAEELAALLNYIPANLHSRLLFLLCNTQNSETYLSALQALCHPGLNIRLSPPTDLAQYIALVAASDIAVCIDSGTVHLACGFRKPLLAFYANHSENFGKWHPLAGADVPLKIVRARQSGQSLKTADFPLDEAAEWLNSLLSEMLQLSEN